VETAQQWIIGYGYVAFFCILMFGIIGAPFPDDLVLLFSGYLISAGYLKPAPALASAFFGSVCGITVSYALGRLLGFPAVARYGHYLRIKQETYHKMSEWYNRFGRWGLLIGYFIAGVRHWTAFFAGVSKLKMPSFALFAYTGGLLWAITLLSTGYVLGEEWTCLATRRSCYTYMYILIGICLATSLIGWLMHRRFGILSFIPMKIFEKGRNTVL
jgi:membrane protein DedA with SNARE-associated domain